MKSGCGGSLVAVPAWISGRTKAWARISAQARVVKISAVLVGLESSGLARTQGISKARRLSKVQGNASMECTVKWIDGVSFVAETGSGHALVMDGAAEGGGRNLGPRPMEMVLLGTGGCSAYDVVVILKKSGQEISGCSVELKAERAETDPKIFTRIHMHFVLRGRNLKTSMVESAIKLSHQKYCSASIMLAKSAEITHDYEILAE
jgi:putative redox protein